MLEITPLKRGTAAIPLFCLSYEPTYPCYVVICYRLFSQPILMFSFDLIKVRLINIGPSPVGANTFDNIPQREWESTGWTETVKFSPDGTAIACGNVRVYMNSFMYYMCVFVCVFARVSACVKQAPSIRYHMDRNSEILT